MSALATETIRDEAALAALAPEWRRLWERSRAATPFQCPDWLTTWWRFFHPGELRCIAVRDGDRLVGLVPFYLEAGPRGRRLLPVGISLSDYLDVLLDPKCADEAGSRIAEAFDRLAGWQSWNLEELPPDADGWRIAGPAHWQESAPAQSTAPVLVLPDTIDRLGDRIPSRKLRKLRMARNRAARRDGMAVTRIENDAIPAFIDDLFRLHGSRWQSRGETGLLTGEVVRRFHAAAIPEMAQAGLARLYALSLEGRVVGAYYGFLHRDRAYAYLGGFDPDFAYESPGTILIGHAIEEAVREGAREFHFLRGREAYKYEWGAEDRWNRRRSFRMTVPDVLSA